VTARTSLIYRVLGNAPAKLRKPESQQAVGDGPNVWLPSSPTSRGSPPVELCLGGQAVLRFGELPRTLNRSATRSTGTDAALDSNNISNATVQDMGTTDRLTARPRIATATTLKTSLQQSLEFAAYHHNLGVDEVILLFDDPADPAAEILSGKPGVTVIRCDNTHWSRDLGEKSRPEKVQQRQRANMNWLIRKRSSDLDWLVSIDSDELIWAPHGLHGTLPTEGADFSVLQLMPLEAVPASPTSTDPFREVSLFRAHRPERYETAHRLHVDSGFAGPDEFLRGHIQGKPAIRLDGTVTEVRIHRAVGKDPERFRKGRSSGMRVLHFDSGSLDQWKSKWRNRQEFSRPRSDKHRTEQWDEFERLDSQGDEAGLERLYRDYFMLPKKEIPILRALGLLKRVRLDPTWFDWPD
jgi:hypothetical protein